MEVWASSPRYGKHHAKGKVYKPTIDRPTWLRWGDPILRTIVSRAHLAEIETEHWVRDTGHNPDRISRQH